MIKSRLKAYISDVNPLVTAAFLLLVAFIQALQVLRKSFSNKRVQLKIALVFQNILLSFHFFQIIMFYCCPLPLPMGYIWPQSDWLCEQSYHVQ